MLCERCDKEIRPGGELPTLELKTLGIYPSERMTIGMVETAFSALVGSASGELASVSIATAARFNPRQLHRIPALPINAYPLINGVGIRISCATAAPTSFAFALKYRDIADVETLTLAYRLPAGVVEDAVTSPLAPVVSSSVLGEKPATFGTWVLEGSIVIGASTGVTVTVFANLGVLYGAPK